MGRKRRAREVSSSLEMTVAQEVITLSDDEEQGNADLTLSILAKAEKRRRKRVKDRAGAEVVVLESDDNVRSEREEAEAMEGAGPSGGLEQGVEVEEGELNDAAEPEAETETEAVVPKPLGRKKRKKKERKEKKEKRKKEKEVKSVVSMEDAKTVSDESAEVKPPDPEQSLAMRKLLRGPRYFDPPEEQGETCYSCGKQGHRAAGCTEQPRDKPCYVCGNFGHDGYDCPEKTECFECGKSGHVARNCPNKHFKTRRHTGLCLLCGRLGHDSANCSGEYDPQDFKQVQCYVCKRTGHLCCIEVSDASPTPVSCYQCGDLGHTGVGCTRQNGDRGDRSSCYKCGQEGHFARECNQMGGDYNMKQRRHSWPAPWAADNERYGDEEPVTPGCHIRPASFKSRLEQASSGKNKHYDENRRGSKRKWKETEDERWIPRSSDSHRKRSRD